MKATRSDSTPRHDAARKSASKTAPGKKTLVQKLASSMATGRRREQHPSGQTTRDAAPSDTANESIGAMPYLDGLQHLHGSPGDSRASEPNARATREHAEQGTRASAGPLPHLGAIQRAFGSHDVSGVQAHLGDDARQASEALGAEAYAMGEHVVFRGAPDLHTAAHEAAHIVQQRQGVQLEDGIGQRGDEYEQRADAVADAVARGQSAEALLGNEHAGGTSHAVQCKLADSAAAPDNARSPRVRVDDAYDSASTARRDEVALTPRDTPPRDSSIDNPEPAITQEPDATDQPEAVQPEQLQQPEQPQQPEQLQQPQQLQQPEQPQQPEQSCNAGAPSTPGAEQQPQGPDQPPPSARDESPAEPALTTHGTLRSARASLARSKAHAASRRTARMQQINAALHSDAAASLASARPVPLTLELPEREPPQPPPERPWPEIAQTLAAQPEWQDKLEQARTELEQAAQRADDGLEQVEDGHEQLEARRAQLDQTAERMAEQADAPHPAAQSMATQWQERAAAATGELDGKEQELDAAGEQASAARDEVQARLDELPAAGDMGPYIAANGDIERAFEERAAPQRQQHMADMQAQHAAQQAAYEEEAQQKLDVVQADIAAQQQRIQQQSQAEIAAAQADLERRADEVVTRSHGQSEMAHEETSQLVAGTAQEGDARAADIRDDGQAEAGDLEASGEQQAMEIMAAAQARAAALAASASGGDGPSVQMKPHALQFRVDAGIDYQSGGNGRDIEEQSDEILQQGEDEAQRVRDEIAAQVVIILETADLESAQEIRDAGVEINALLDDQANRDLLGLQEGDRDLRLTVEVNGELVEVILNSNEEAVDNLVQFRIADLNGYYEEGEGVELLRRDRGSIGNYADGQAYSYDLLYDYEMMQDGNMGLVFDFRPEGIDRRVIASTILPYDDIMNTTGAGNLGSADREVTSNILLNRELGTGRALIDQNWLFSATGIDYSVDNRISFSHGDLTLAGCTDEGATYSGCATAGGYSFNMDVSLDANRQGNYTDPAMQHIVARYGIVDRLVSNQLITNPAQTSYQAPFYGSDRANFPRGGNSAENYIGSHQYMTADLVDENSSVVNLGNRSDIYDMVPVGNYWQVISSNGDRDDYGRYQLAESEQGGGHVSFDTYYPGAGGGIFPSRLIPYNPGSRPTHDGYWNDLAANQSGHLGGRVEPEN